LAGGKVSILVDPDFTGFPQKLQAGLSGATGAAGNAGRLIGTALAAGTAVAAVGFKQVIDLGIQYQNSMNTLQAVTGATADQMARVGQTATALGSDLSLPATSAADAAAAMTELAKGGLTVEQSMTAAKGTLQLAAAAQIDGAKAAEIQTNALNTFGLSADNAGRVADVLANVANASSGEITDFAAALQAGGAVAAQFGISIEDTATALGLFANSGIKGSDAGTLLKSALLALASPSKQGAVALKELGVNAFNAQGQFVGLPAIFDQLNAASKRMTPEQYAAAASIAFGSDAARLAGIAARTSSSDWDKMSTAVGKSGGAADVAAAKTKGLGGAWEGLKSQLETVALGLFDKIQGPLTSFVTQASTNIPKVADTLGRLGTQAKTVLTPLATGFLNVVKSLKPVADGIGAVVTSGTGLGVVAGAVKLLGDALTGASVIIGPLASLVGGLLTVFAGLPGPIQSAVLALVALKVGPAILSGLTAGFRGTNTEGGKTGKVLGTVGSAFRAITAPVAAVVSGVKTAGTAVKSFGDEMKVQSALAQGYGKNLTTAGAAHAAFATSANPAVTAVRGFTTALGAIKASVAAGAAPLTGLQATMKALAESHPETAIGGIAKAFDTAAAGATRFKTTAGLAAGVGKTITSGLGSLVSFLGGPWGVALAGAGVALALLGAKQEEAKKKADEHKASLETLRGTLSTLNGAITQDTINTKANELAKDGTLAKVKDLNINTNDYVKAMLGESGAMTSVNAQLAAHTQSLIAASPAYTQNTGAIQALGLSLETLTQAALGNPAAINAVNDAVRTAGGTSLEAQQHYQGLVQSLMDAAAPAANLAKAIGLSVPEVQKLQAEQALAAEASKNFSDSLALIGPALGGLKNGVAPTAAMNTALAGLGATAATTAQKAGDAAAAIGGNAAGAAAASAKMQELRDAFVEVATKALGSADAANALADKIGLIPAKAATDFTTNAPTVTQQIAGVVAEFNKVPGTKTIVINAPTADAQQRLKDLGFAIKDLGNGKVEISIDANDALARAKVDGLKTSLNGILGVAKIDADASLGTQKGDQLKAYIDQLTALMQGDLNIQPGTDKANQLKSLIDAMTGLMIGDANTDPGKQKADELKQYTDGLKAAITVDADVEQAIQQIDAFIQTQQGKQIRIPILATGGLAAGGIVEKYAKGGLAGARPMRANYGQIVPPRRFRLIGDRSRDDEAFIPINRSARSRMLLLIAAQRMGFDLIRKYAEGGISAAQGQGLALTRLSTEVRNAATVPGGAKASTGATAPTIGTLNVAPPNSIGPSAVANEVIFKMRHYRRGVHSDR
jgi:TP901 family phage tail tape measure protein